MTVVVPKRCNFMFVMANITEKSNKNAEFSFLTIFPNNNECSSDFTEFIC